MKWKSYLPITFIILCTFMAYMMGINEWIGYEELKKYRITWLHFVQEHPFTAPLLFMSIYILVIALSIPGGAVLSITGGFLFAQPYSTIYVVIGATIGATGIFYAVKSAFIDVSKIINSKTIHKLQAGFQENAASYLLFLRFLPLFPFWLVNIAPAFFKVPIQTFIWTTFIGIIPGAFAFTQTGVGIGSLLDAEEQFSLNTIFTNEMKIALIALSFFVLLPIAIKKLYREK